MGKLITLYTTIKPMYRDEEIKNQTAAIESWTKLRPEVDILIVGREKGVDSLIDNYGICLVGPVKRNEYGTPLVNDVIRLGETHSGTDLVCMINADDILDLYFLDAIHKLNKIDKFVAFGRRTLFGESDGLHWSTIDKHGAKDYFIYRKSEHPFGEIPDFAFGRITYDSWLAGAALKNGFKLIDATYEITVKHPDHDYNHMNKGDDWIWKGPEAHANVALRGNIGGYFEDATHKLTEKGVIPIETNPV
jgi:hypothetical protein